VIAPANTGKARINNTVVIRIDHKNKEIFVSLIFLGRIFKIVTIKLIDLKIDEKPAI
jgi:hypothetical protein